VAFFPAFDGIGFIGTLVAYVFAFTFFVGAILVFFYLWKKGRLDMDQEPAEKMLEEDNKGNKSNEQPKQHK
jgi:uncharacterized membrane protein YciS (DUF1049 family)